MDLDSDACLDVIDIDALERWLSKREPVAGPLRLSQIAGGRSNLTYRIMDADGASWVLRRPPLGHVLESAHDVHREYRMMRRLKVTAVPVPQVVGYESESDVTDTAFFVTAFVEGVTLRTVEDAQALTVASRQRASDRFIDVLLELHELPVAPGEAKQESYVARQLRVWRRQMLQKPVRKLPAFDEAARLLEMELPEQSSTTLIHGDYRLDNALLGTSGSVNAVLDWELSTVGDPLADLATAMIYWIEPEDDLIPLDGAPTHAEGFHSWTQLRERYERGSRRDISGLDYYIAFAYWRFAAILEGVRRRTLSGAYGDDPEELNRFEWVVPALAERSLKCLARGAS